MTMNKLLTLKGFIYKMELIIHLAAVSKLTHSSLQNTKHYARTWCWFCGCRQVSTLQSLSQWPFPLWCHSWWHPKFIFLSSLKKKKKNVTAPESQSSQAGFLSPCVSSSITRKNNTERTTPMTVSWRERAWGSPSVCSICGDRTFQRHDPDSAAPHREVAIGRHIIPCKRTHM